MKATSITTALLAGFASTSPLSSRSVDFQWGDDHTKVKGVNIGGWLVLEPWITPTIFNKYNDDTVDEWTLCENHPDEAPGILQQHWASWLKKEDLQTIYNAGFNVIRIPVGYWAFQKFNDPYYKGDQTKYLDTAIGWAGEIGLKVVIDLHGAPLSQNGYDNSGHNGSALWTSEDSIKHTESVIRQIASSYANKQKVVVGIQLLNEPNPDKLPGGHDNALGNIKQFYSQGYNDVRKVSDTPVILHDAFEVQGSYWNGFMPSTTSKNVIIDHHEYQVFTEELINLSLDGHVNKVCENAGKFAGGVGHWTIVGEWSAALTDCAAGLNGWHIGSRWEGNYIDSKGATGRSCGNINFDSEWSSNQQLRANTQKFIKAQVDTYLQQTKGFFFWNLKTEISPEWDLLRLLKWELFPSMKDYEPTGSACS